MKDKVQLIIDACEEKIAKDVKAIRLKEKAFADYFILATGNTSNQTQAIADEVEEALEKENYDIFSKEGYREGEWILMDIGDVIVHIFTPEQRDYYDLERLWSNNR